MKYVFVFLLLGLTSVVNAQTETAKQPDCDVLDGVQIDDLERAFEGGRFVPNDYTGIVFGCKHGKVKSLYNYKDGELDGLHRGWRYDGQLWYEYNYKDGEYDGLWREWYENGQLKVEANYKDGKDDGLWREWYENGQLEMEANYKDGELISSKCWDTDLEEIDCD